MAYLLMPLLVFALFLGLNAIESTQVNKTLPSSTVIQATHDGSQFIAYSNAVATYLTLNPGFVGVVPAATLIAQGNQFSAEFLATAGNNITQIGVGTGRIVTCFANISPASVTAALQITANDASIGIANGGNWISYAQNANQAPQALATAVPNGDVVSVVQIGN